jgi:hypothetical protein
MVWTMNFKHLEECGIGLIYNATTVFPEGTEKNHEIPVSRAGFQAGI